jgi:hypothetical protein
VCEVCTAVAYAFSAEDLARVEAQAEARRAAARESAHARVLSRARVHATTPHRADEDEEAAAAASASVQPLVDWPCCAGSKCNDRGVVLSVCGMVLFVSAVLVGLALLSALAFRPNRARR